MSIQLSTCSAFPQQNNYLVIGSRLQLLHSEIYEQLGIDQITWTAVLRTLIAKENPRSTRVWAGKKQVIVAVLPEICSRHNSRSHSWAVTSICESTAKTADWGICIFPPAGYLEATAIAVAKAFPTFTMASQPQNRTIHLHFVSAISEKTGKNIQALIDGVRLAANLVDRPTNVLNVSDFIAEAQKVALLEGASISILHGEDLKHHGFGGIWGVGKAAKDLPALVCLQWQPENATKHVAWVGKGIVYDTGGLSIKSKTGMPSMKGDMGGAAAVMAAFRVAVECDVPYAITAVLCLAENAVGPDATRPDDILTLYSGKTVEINNTDAEGRLVVADGVAWVAKTFPVHAIVDMATLTGAASAAVGKRVAAIYCNHEELEKKAVYAGRICGELCHPLPYIPEFWKMEFSSSVADMKNSVKNRGNAQSACAGQFIGNHLPVQTIPWLHVDMSGPSKSLTKRGRGYGVGLLLQLSANL